MITITEMHHQYEYQICLVLSLACMYDMRATGNATSYYTCAIFKALRVDAYVVVAVEKVARMRTS